ncbi:hypothetical protein JHW43_007371 [Diplocarpon mali]|nr:hypothetical protein JHW43_007371 [Diplocarpon mali]
MSHRLQSDFSASLEEICGPRPGMAMAPEVLIFMPNGDVTLKLTRHIVSEPIAQVTEIRSSTAQELVDEDAEIEAALGIEPPTPADEENLVFYAPDAPGADDGPFYPPTPRARGSDASRRDRSPSPPASFWAALKRQAEQVNGTGDAVDGETASAMSKEREAQRIVLASHEVQAICSSRHLMLASRYFERILSGEFKEARVLRTTGHVQIEFLEEDLESMIILLNIIHGASRKVPRILTLEGLGTLAALVSKFAMLESVDFFSDTWIDQMKREGLPKVYSRDVVRLLYVFWVFDREKEFGDMTRLAQRESDEGFEEDVKGLAIPRGIVEAIKTGRQSAIESAMSIVHALITRYMDGSDHCDAALDDELRYACDAMVLGSLLKSSRKIGLWPKPQAPFPGRKWRDVAKDIRGIRILDVCNKTSSRRWNSHGPSGNAHGIEDEIEGALKDVEKGLSGLKLKDYAKKIDDYIPVYVPEPEVLAPVACTQEALVPLAHSNGSLNSNTNGNRVRSPEIKAFRGEPRDANPYGVSREQAVPRAEPKEYHESHESSSASLTVTAANNSPNTTPSPAPPYRDVDGEDPRQQTPQVPQQIRGRGAPQALIRENKSQPETKQEVGEQAMQSLFSWRSSESRDHPAPVRESPMSQHSSGSVQQEAQAHNLSPEASAHEVSSRKPMPGPAAPQNHYHNGSSAPTGTPLAHAPVKATNVSGPVAATNGFSQHAQAKPSPRNSIQEAASPKPPPVPPPHKDPSPNSSVSTSSSPSSKYGISSSSYSSQPIIHQDVQRQPQSPPRHSRHDISSAKATPPSPPNQNDPQNHNSHSPPSAPTSNSARRANATSTPLPPSPQEELPTPAPIRREPIYREATQREAIRSAAPDRRLVRTPSNPQIPLVREDMKSPTPSHGRILSLDDAALGIHSRNLNSHSNVSTRNVYKNNGHTSSNHEDRNATIDNFDSTSNSNSASRIAAANNGHGHLYQEERRSTTSNSDRKGANGANSNKSDRKAANGERKSPSPPALAMAAVNKGREAREVAGGRESPLKQVQSAENERDGEDKEVLDIEELDAWVPPAQNFRVRKGKKVFTNRFS